MQRKDSHSKDIHSLSCNVGESVQLILPGISRNVYCDALKASQIEFIPQCLYLVHELLMMALDDSSILNNSIKSI